MLKPTRLRLILQDLFLFQYQFYLGYEQKTHHKALDVNSHK